MPEDKIVTDRWYTRSGGWPGFDKDAQVIDLFTDRNRLAIAIILDHIKSVDNKEIANQLKFNLISSLIRSSNRMYTTSVVKSYYQVPSVGKVQNVWSVFKRKFNNLQKSKKQLLRNAKIESKRDLEDKLKVYNLDARNIPVEDSSVDYVFFDPPYGSQVGYYELNLFYSAWLKEYSEDFENEIIIPMETDDEDEYVDKWGEMIDSVVSESGRILKDGGYLTIAFHSKYNKIWNKLIGVFEDNNFVFKDFVDFDRGTTIHTNRLSDTNVKSAFVTFLNTKERSIRSRTGDNGHSKEEIKSHLKNSLDLLEADFRRVRDEVVRAVYERDLGSVPSEEEIRSMLDDIS
jgi:adenine-specific DNA methylase